MCFRRPQSITRQSLLKRNDETTAKIINLVNENQCFQDLSKKALHGIRERDRLDEQKLARGIQIAIDKKLIPERVKEEPTKEIIIDKESAAEVAKQIYSFLPKKQGAVMILYGNSGVGKGTAVAELSKLLDRTYCWSNGNVFRCLTHLVLKDGPLDFKKLIDANYLSQKMKKLSFVKRIESYDIKLQENDNSFYVSEIQDTLLKTEDISKNIPLVAEYSQGEVINFTLRAVEQLREDGFFVICEGREATLQYIRTSLRFRLVLKDESQLGQRRVAQRLLGQILDDKSEDLITYDDFISTLLKLD